MFHIMFLYDIHINVSKLFYNKIVLSFQNTMSSSNIKDSDIETLDSLTIDSSTILNNSTETSEVRTIMNSVVVN